MNTIIITVLLLKRKDMNFVLCDKDTCYLQPSHGMKMLLL